jgi:hypothetical protein
MAKMTIHTEAHGVFILDDVKSVEIDGLRFWDAGAIAKLFEHPERIIRLSRKGEKNDMPCFEILSTGTVLVDDMMAQHVKTIYGLDESEHHTS